MTRKLMMIAAVFAVFSLTGTAHAAKKEKIQYYPHYWMSISTGNQSIPGMNEQMSGMAALFGAKSAFGPRRTLQLQLESPGRMPEKPEAQHDIPAKQSMGKSLLLLTPEPVKETKETPTAEGEKPQKIEKPKARMLIYWGCDDTVRKGQPKVIDTEKMSMMEFGKAMVGHMPTQQYPPSAHNGWVYGEWPNREDNKDVPQEGSLVGEHLVHGNYVTDIRFNIDQKHDFMAPVEFSSVKATPSGAIRVEWKDIPTAIGYFATVMAHNPETGETILWSSSEGPEPGFALMNYLTNSDVRRFIKEKVVMPAGTTTCIVPPALKDLAGALQFIAYGEEMDLSYPPKPKDPKQPWNPKWSVKVRLKSTGMTTLAETQERKGAAGKKAKQAAPSDKDGDSRDKQGKDDDSGPSKNPINRLKGIFGF